MNTILETGIALVLIFLIFSIITYVIQELIAVNLKYRSKMLWKAMAQIFDEVKLPGRMKLTKTMPVKDAPATEEFYHQPLIQLLHQNLSKRPNYIPAASFALALMDMVVSKLPSAEGRNDMLADIKAALPSYADSRGKIFEVLKTLANTSNSAHDLQMKIEAWFNSYMNRVTGWYQSHTVASVRFIAIIITLVFNINVINLGKVIYKNGQLRTNLVALADNVVDHPETVTRYYGKTFEQRNNTLISYYDDTIKRETDDAIRKKLEKEKADALDTLAASYTKLQLAAIDTLTGKLKSADLPVGWTNSPFSCSYWQGAGSAGSGFMNFLLALLGWLIGAGCISMGAPFWFDLLGKLVNVRRSGVKPSASSKT